MPAHDDKKVLNTGKAGEISELYRIDTDAIFHKYFGPAYLSISDSKPLIKNCDNARDSYLSTSPPRERTTVSPVIDVFLRMHT